jgi:hypothetical protein
VAALIGQAVVRGELAPETDPVQGAMAYGSFYLANLVMGLKQPVFDVPGQIALVAGLMDKFFPERLKTGLEGKGPRIKRGSP